MFWIIFFVVTHTLCFFIGLWLYRMHMYGNVCGYLRIDRSIPEDSPYMFLELYDTSVKEIEQQKMVSFLVNTKNYLQDEGDQKM